MQIGIAEFLENVSRLKKKDEKINALRYNDSFVLRTILQGAYHPNVVWLLPEGIPPYTPNVLVDQENVLIRECRKLEYYIEGPFPGLNQIKRETMFVQMLENVAPKDALLLCALKEKKLPWKGIDKELVKEAFPELIP